LKWAVLLLCLIIVPVMGAMLRRSPKMLPWAAFAMAFLPFVMNQWKLSFAPVAWPGWPGWPKGIEFNVLDFLAVAVLLAVPKRPGLKPLVPWLLYLLAVLVTVPLAGVKMAAMFYVWQLTRVMVIFLAVIQLARAPKAGQGNIFGDRRSIAPITGTMIRQIHSQVGQSAIRTCSDWWPISRLSPVLPCGSSDGRRSGR
jgi:hypothetical protein